jgi:NAD-reducing hydrogenase small subunit
MSFLDMDERLLELAPKFELVYSPLVDHKEFPEGVDVTLVEGAVSSEDDLAKIKKIRAHTRVLVSLGDCAVTGNVPSMRNVFPVQDVLRRAYVENAVSGSPMPDQVVPRLLNRVSPVHEVVEVDVFVPGCPPSADTIFATLSSLIAGLQPDFTGRTRFGA